MMMISILVIHKILLDPIFYTTLYFNFYCIIVCFICSLHLIIKVSFEFCSGFTWRFLLDFSRDFLDVFFFGVSLVFFKFVLGSFQAFVSKAHLGLILGFYFRVFQGFILGFLFGNLGVSFNICFNGYFEIVFRLSFEICLKVPLGLFLRFVLRTLWGLF